MIISIDFSGIMHEVSLSKHWHLTHGLLLQSNALKPRQSEKKNPLILLIYFVLVSLNAWDNFHIFSVNKICRCFFSYLC